MRSRIGLNALNFFTAAVQAGFGPFVAVWLADQGWTAGETGVALSIGSLAALAAQLPGGYLVDRLHANRLASALGLLGLGGSALLLALPATRGAVWGAEIAHGLASCAMTPALAALTLSLCGHAAFGARLGVNARYAALGNAAAAALLGLAASLASEQAVFLLTAALALPAIAALGLIRASDRIEPALDHPALLPPGQRPGPPWHIVKEPALLVFAAAAVLFQLANAGLLPLALNGLVRDGGGQGWVVSATVILPQAVTALISPWAGALAERLGRRPVLLAGFAAVPLRAALFALTPGALPLLAVQALDGISAAVLGVMLPLIAADATRRTGHLNLAIGALGLASGLGATVGTLLAGAVADRAGEAAAFLCLSAAGILGVALVALAMPETRPRTPG